MSSPLIPIEQALAAILQQLGCIASAHERTVPECSGCVVADDVVSAGNVPDYDNSAMDGYAVNTSTLLLNEPLPVAQTIAAGHPGESLASGSAARIFTGAPVPEGSDAVVMQENTRRDGDRIAVTQLPEPGENIRRKGHDIAAGSLVLQAGHRLRAQDLGLLSSLGLTTLAVRAPLKVALINTGDEVVAPGTPLEHGQLYDSNSYTLEGLLKGLGHTVVRYGIVEDSLETTVQVLQIAAEACDCLITTGGVSVGDEDHVRKAVEQLGEISLWKLAIKPGKPFAFGFVGSKPFFGLPGNPVAVFVTFTQLVRACLLKLQGASKLQPAMFYLPAGFDEPRTGSRQEYIRVRVIDEGGKQVLEPFGNQGSSIMTSLTWADGLAVVPVNTPVKKGDMLVYFPFEGLL
jgi:molybdopterin molybdotransferase